MTRKKEERKGKWGRMRQYEMEGRGMKERIEKNEKKEREMGLTPVDSTSSRIRGEGRRNGGWRGSGV